MIHIEFPFLPVSVNTAFYTDFKSKTRHKTKPYRDFKKNLVDYLPKGIRTLKNALKIEYNFYFPDRRRRDICNYEKTLTDTLVDYGIMEDDSQIERIVIEKYYDKGNPYTVAEISEM